VDQRASFLELAMRLLADLGRLLDQRLALLKTELAQEAMALAKNLALVAAGTVAASVGIAFLLLALGLWVGQLVGSTSGGLALVGGGLGALGALLALPALRSLQHRRFAQETLRELRRDAEWIRDSA
jgi:hypothetical protein